MSLFSKLLSKKFSPDYEGKNQINSNERKHGIWIEGPLKWIHAGGAIGEGLKGEYTMWSEGAYDNGNKVGQWISYYEHNSQILLKENYVRSTAPDYVEAFYPTGELRRVDKGNRYNKGTWGITYYFKNGTISDEEVTTQINSKRKIEFHSKKYNRDGSLHWDFTVKGLVKVYKYYSKEGHLLHHAKRVYKKDNNKTYKETNLHGSYDDYLKYYGLSRSK
jgi:hypothetical protein